MTQMKFKTGMKHTAVREIPKKEYQEIHIQLTPESNETIEQFIERLTRILNENNAQVIRATFFGSLSKKANTVELLKEYLTTFDFPISWIEGDNCSKSFINGVYVFAVSGIEVTRLYNNNIPVGSVFQTTDAEFCYLGGLYSDPELSPYHQAEKLFSITENILNQAGLSFIHTIRTWFYLDDILSWYGDFNKVRTAFFRRHKIFDNMVPASTGIEGKNPADSKICLELTAIKPKSKAFTIDRVRSPLQCSAEDYGSSFSRAIRYSDGQYSHLTVSGTASIGPDGDIFHANDPLKQMEVTFAVVNEILKEQHFDFNDAVRAYAYLRDKSYKDTFDKYLETASFPIETTNFISTENAVCWEELLFEIEFDFIKETG